MNDQATPLNELERALSRVQADGELAAWETRTEVLRQLALNTVAVIVDQPLGDNPDQEITGTPTFVTNGDDQEQAMLAIFSSEERARAYLEDQQLGGRYPISVPGPRALLAVPDGVGIRINPNQDLGFIILPSLAERLREDIKQVIERQGG